MELEGLILSGLILCFLFNQNYFIRHKSEKQTTQTEDILNSILPPRFASLIFGVNYHLIIYLKRMDRRWSIVGAICIQHTCDTFRCHQPPGYLCFKI